MMKIYGLIAITMILFLSATQSFAYEYRIRDMGNGYCYTFKNVCYQDFTEDENFQLPEDKSVAEGRFRRRKEYVEKWNLEYRPGDFEKHNWFLEIPVMIFGIATFPISFPLFEWLDEKQRSKPEEIEKVRQSNLMYEKACEQMHEFIVKDCLFERKEKLNQKEAM